MLGLTDKILKIGYIPLILGLIIFAYLFYKTDGDLEDKTKETKVLNEKIQELMASNEILVSQLDTEKTNYSISQKNVKELKELLAKKPEKETVYVDKYIEKPTADKCVISNEWLLGYDEIRNNPYTNLSTDKD